MTLSVCWHEAIGDADALAHYFVANVDSSYISHGELLCGRAVAPGQWAPDVEAVVALELESILSGAEPGKRVAVAREDGNIVGLAIVDLEASDATPCAVIEDIIVGRDARGSGRGAAFLGALVDLLRADGHQGVLLESGIENARAHSFFERHGFEVVSKVLFRRI